MAEQVRGDHRVLGGEPRDDVAPRAAPSPRRRAAAAAPDPPRPTGRSPDGRAGRSTRAGPAPRSHRLTALPARLPAAPGGAGASPGWQTPKRRRPGGEDARWPRPTKVARRRAEEAQEVDLRARARAPAARAGQAPGARQGQRAAGRGRLRGPRRGRQGRRDQAHHGGDEPAGHARRRAAGAERPRAHAVVLPALRRPAAGGRGDRPVRPQLVQPRRRRAGDGLLHGRRVRGVHARLPAVRGDAPAVGDPAAQVLVLGLRRRAGAPVPGAPRRTPRSTGSSARWTSSRAAAGSTTRAPRTRCSPARTPSAARGGWSRPTTSAARG